LRLRIIYFRLFPRTADNNMSQYKSDWQALGGQPKFSRRPTYAAVTTAKSKRKLWTTGLQLWQWMKLIITIWVTDSWRRGPFNWFVSARPKRDSRARVRAARGEAGVKVTMQVPTVNRVSNRGKISWTNLRCWLRKFDEQVKRECPARVSAPPLTVTANTSHKWRNTAPWVRPSHPLFGLG
jgi:hypothetical protein